MGLKKIIEFLKTRKLILLITFFYTLAVLILLLNRFWQYEAFYYDHGMMEGTAYQISQFKLPLHDREYGKVLIYVDHLYPSLQLVLAPFYWLWDAYETPIVVMSLLIGFSVIIGYEIANKMIKNKVMVYVLLFAYMFYIGLQNALIYLIHDLTMQIPFLMLLFWAIVNKKIKLFYLLLLFNFGFKESVAVVGFTLGVVLFFCKKEWRKHGLATAVISFFYGLISTKLLIPYFKYLSFGTWKPYGYSPEFPSNFLEYFTRFFDSAAKRETIFVSLCTFGFLPLFSLFSLPMVFQDFAQRFVLLSPNNPFRQGLNLHYNASLAVLLFVGSVFTVARLQKKSWYRKRIIFHAFFIFLATGVYHRFIYHGPFGLLTNRDFFKITRNMKFMDDFVAKIPRRGKIMVQNNLAVRFTHDDLYLLASEEYLRKVDPDVVVLDFRPGQNINNFWPVTEVKMEKLSKTLLNDPGYNVLYQEGHRYIFVKKHE